MDCASIRVPVASFRLWRLTLGVSSCGGSKQAPLMPIIPKFSRQTYETLGQDVVEELVEWLNSVYDAKRETAELRRSLDEILGEVRALRLAIIEHCPHRP
jgi:hypothetical protein